MNKNKNYVFISYSRLDYVNESGVPMTESPVTRLMAFLDDSRIPYWIDKKGIYPGDKYIKLISEAICNSSLMLFISSAASNQSEWTLREVCLAQEKGKLIIPIRIDDTPFNSSISLLVSTLDRIDYYAFQEKSFDSLLKAIQVELGKWSTDTEPDPVPSDETTKDFKEECTGEEVKGGRQKEEDVIVEDNLMDRFPELKLKPSCFLRVFTGKEDDPQKAYRKRVLCLSLFVALLLLYVAGVGCVFYSEYSEYSEYMNIIVGVVVGLCLLCAIFISYWDLLRQNMMLFKSVDYCQLNEKNAVISLYVLVAKGSKFGVWNHKKSSFQIQPEYDYLEWREYGKLLKATKDGKVFTIDIYGRQLM